MTPPVKSGTAARQLMPALAICGGEQRVMDGDSVSSTVTLKEGGMLYGRIIYRNEKEIAVAANPFDFSILTKTPIGDVASVEPSQISMMPPGTIAPMNKDELSDLIAYLISGGDPKHKVFKPK